MIQLSIIIPVYNVERYIRQCLDSIFIKANIGLSFEVIIVDDETPDNSMLIIDEFVNLHSNITVLHQKNQGQGPARDYGIDVAKGKYIWLVDSDDWIEPWAISTIVKQIGKNTDTDIFAVPATWCYEDTQKNWVDLNFEADTVMTGIEYQKKYQMAAWQFVTKRSLLVNNNIRFYPGILHEDGLWGFEITYLAKKLMVIAQPKYCYRQRQEGSVMHNIRIKSAYDIIKVHELLMKFMDKHVIEEHKIWWQKNHLLRIQDATYVVWHLRHTKEFNQYLKDTKAYRYEQCDKCMKLGDISWKVKCWLMKYPVLNEYIRIVKKKITKCLH